MHDCQLKAALHLRGNACIGHLFAEIMAPKAPTVRKAGGTTETDQTGATEPSQGYDRGQPLQHLNKRTSRCGSWILKVYKADLVQYNYPWGGKEVPVTKLRVIFTTIEEGWYCTAIMKLIKKNVAELTDARDKRFTVGSLFRASRVAFVDEKIQYIHTPFKLVIDLRNTTFAALLSVPFPVATGASPPSDVADIVSIKTEGVHRFDITGLCTMGEVRYAETARGIRAIVDIEVLDGSITDNGKKATFGFPMFVPCSTQGAMPEDLIKFKNLVDNQKPISFFCLSAVRSVGKKLEVKTPDEFYWEGAVGAKAERLQPLASQLTSLSAEEKEKLTPEDAWTPALARDFLAEQAIHSSLVLVDAYFEGNAAAAGDTVFQINYVEIEAPGPGTKVVTNEGDRIWIASATLLDHSGTFNNIGIREKAALDLAGLDPLDPQAKEIFQKRVQDGTIQFPPLSWIRIHMRTKPASQDQSGELASQSENQGSQTRLTIVEAGEQDLTQPPNQSYIDLLRLINECHPRTDGLVAAPMAAIRKSAHYPIAVEFDGQLRACHKVLTLVASTSRAIQDPIDSENLRLSTPDVLDLIGANEPETQAKYTLVGMCSRNSLKDVLLDPPRTGKKQQAALAIITDVLEEKTFLLQVVQLVPEADLAVTKKLMEALITVNRRTQFAGVGARPNWTTPNSGLMSQPRKCRRLGACPTDKSIGNGTELDSQPQS